MIVAGVFQFTFFQIEIIIAVNIILKTGGGSYNFTRIFSESEEFKHPELPNNVVIRTVYFGNKHKIFIGNLGNRVTL